MTPGRCERGTMPSPISRAMAWKSPVAFEIFLPQSRIEESRGLWPDRLPIDNLDAAAAGSPGVTAFVGWNSELRGEVRLNYAELAERADKIAVGLLALGVGKGDVV